MHSALFIASFPEHQQKNWGDFLATADTRLEKDKNAKRLAENLWLLDLGKSVSALGILIAAADRSGIVYGILPFEHAPEWLPGVFDPKTIAVRIA